LKIFSKTIRLKNGKILVAANYGLEAFCFEVNNEEHENYKKKQKKNKNK